MFTLENEIYTNFWNAMKGKEYDRSVLASITDNVSSALPAQSLLQMNETIKEENIFRKLGTVVQTEIPDGVIHAVTSTGEAEIVAEGESISESNDTIQPFKINTFKIASMSRLKKSFILDTQFDLEKYLCTDFAKRFGRAEENKFLNGNGQTEPQGLLQKGATVTTSEAGAISYDDLVDLYFSVDVHYRKNSVFMMSDETAMHLRKLKDENGFPIFNDNQNTIFGKPVHVSAYMPAIESGKKAILFGDLAYFWVIERQPIAIKMLTELYSRTNEIGYLAHEQVDGQLIHPDAIQILQIK